MEKKQRDSISIDSKFNSKQINKHRGNRQTKHKKVINNEKLACAVRLDPYRVSEISNHIPDRHNRSCG